MEQEAPLIFHTAFALVILLSVIFLMRWRKMSSEKKPVLTIVYFVLLQIPAYVLLFYSLVLSVTSEDRTFTFGLAGVIWAVSMLVLMQGIKDLLKIE